MNIDFNRVIAQSKVFRALNGKDMTIADYIRKTSDNESLAEFIELFKKKNKEDILYILEKPVEELPNFINK